MNLNNIDISKLPSDVRKTLHVLMLKTGVKYCRDDTGYLYTLVI